MRRLAVVTLVLMLVLPSAALGGGGTSMRSPDDFVEPGETVEMVVYENVSTEQLGDGPWVAHLALEPMADSVEPLWLRLREVEITPVKWSGYGTHRIYVAFEVPVDLEPGTYEVAITNEAGDNLGGVYGWVKVGLPVGQEEAQYEWPLDEPLVAKLPFWATLTWTGSLVKDLRAGRYPLTAAQYLLDPSILEAPGIVLVAPTTTTVPEPTSTAPPTTTALPTTVAVPASAPTIASPVSTAADENAWLPTLAMVLLMLAAVGGSLWLAARGRKVHVVLQGRPMPSPTPTDGGEGFDHHITVDDQALH